MKKFVVGTNDAGQRLDKFLSKLLCNAPMGMIYKWMRKKRVKVNGKKQEISYFLCEGDILELYINDEFFAEQAPLPLHLKDAVKLDVAYEDRNILIVNKPSGLVAHSDGKGGKNLLDMIQAYLYQKGEYSPEVENSFAPSLCNRIDRNTAGLVIAAKNAEALREINEKIRNREINKYYLLHVEKLPEKRNGKIEGYTIKKESENKVYFYREEREGTKHCVTLYRVLNDEGLVEVLLETGRTHQIRASFAAIGCPLKGDVKYGARKDGKRDFQALTAYKIEFDFDNDDGVLGYLKGKTVCIDEQR